MENRISPLELRLQRRFDAPVERVWRAWTDPQALMRWFGPAGTQRVLLAETDVRVGGAYEVGFITADGGEHYASGRYQEVALHRRLVFTWAWRDSPERESLVTVALVPTPGGTRMDFLHEQFVDQAERDDHEGGWLPTVDKLGRYLQANAAA